MQQNNSKQNYFFKQQGFIPEWLAINLKEIQHNVSLEAYDLITKGQKLKLLRSIHLKSQHCSAQNNSKLIESRIQEIKQEEKNLKQKLKEFHVLEKNLKVSRSKKQKISAPDNNQRLKQLCKNYKLFKHSLQQKSKFIDIEQEQTKHRKLEQEEERKNKRKAKNRKKIQQKQKKMNQNQNKGQNKQIFSQQCKIRLRKKKLYQRMTEHYNQQRNQTLSKQYDQFLSNRKKVEVSFETLSQHQQQYYSLLIQRQQKRKNKLEQSRHILPQIHPYKSHFYDQIIEENKSKKLQQQRRIQQAYELHQKHKQYQQRILKEFPPNTKPLQENHCPRTVRKQSLNREQLKKIGNIYYSVGQSKAISKQNSPLKEKIDINENTERKMLLNRIKKYPDYLPQILKQNKVQEIRKNMSAKHMQKVKNIIQDDSRSMKDKIQQINFETNQLYRTKQYNKSNDKNLIEGLKAKIQILKMIR